MAHLGTLKRLLKRFSVPFLACAMCVSSALIGVSAFSNDEAVGVNADSSNLTKDRIGITLIDQVDPKWTADDDPPYIFMYSVTWASKSPHSSFSDFSSEIDGISYDSTVGENGVLKIYATLDHAATHRYYVLQLPWYIASCDYCWKMHSDNRYYAVLEDLSNMSAEAGHTYADYLWARDDSENVRRGTISHVTDPGVDNLASSSVSTTGNAVNLYYVIGGTKSESVSDTRYVWPGELTPVFADIDSPDSDHDFNGFYFSYHEVFGFDNKWTASHVFSDGDIVYVDFRLKGDDYSTGIYLIDDTTPSSDGIPLEGKMFYKSGSSEPYEYYLTKHFDVGDVFLFFDSEHYEGADRFQHTYYNNSSALGSYFKRLGSTPKYTMCGATVDNVFQCLIEGTYTITYAYNASTSSRGIRTVEDANNMEYVYFLKNTATWGDDSVYCYMYNSATKSPAGGSSSWPGCRVGDSTTDLKVTRTGHIKVSYESASISYIYRVAYYPKMGSPDTLIFNNGRDGGEVTGTDKTGNLPLTKGRCYQFKRNRDGTVLTANVSQGPAWLYDFDASLGDATYEGEDFEDSVCAIINDSTLATSLYSRYSSMPSTGQAVVNAATIYTYDAEDPDPEEGDEAVAFSAVISLLADSLGYGESARLVGPRSADSPLTTTLWIVIAAGSTGLLAILVSYWVSKKKKKHCDA